jgi:hypothetical protein
MGQTYQSIVINDSKSNVWEKIRNFHDMSWAPNVVTKLDIIGDLKGDQIGSKRLLNGLFHETLLELNDELKTFAYKIDDGPSPICKDDVKNYIGRITLTDSDSDKTLVEWSSEWENNDEEAYEFCHQIYLALLDDMKNSLE